MDLSRKNGEREAWDWKQSAEWLNKHLAETNIEGLYYRLIEVRYQELYLIQQVVSLNTWVEQVKRTTDIQKRSLRSWIQTIRRIGKGTGKYAAKHQADAQRETAVCRGLVPVWIMLLNRVIENISSSDTLFDVVIVDESSQCDLFALSAVFRGKRVVIGLRR